MSALLTSLKRNVAGSATIELGLAAPFLAALLIGLVDLSTAYSDKLRLEQVAHRTIEKVQQSGFTVAMIPALEAEAEAAAGEGSDAVLTYWLECNGVRMTGSTAYTDGCAENDVYARYIQLDVQKDYAPIIPAEFAGGNADGTLTLHGIAGIRIQ